MIRYFYGSQMEQHAELAAEMFRDRATQFRDRMGWDVTVDDMGWETDQYDVLDPLYVVVEDEKGHHAGSMRFLPTTGRTMLAEIFPHLVDHRPISSPDVWECTRFCLSPNASGRVAQMLLLAASELGLAIGVRQSLGVFDRPMVRVYRRLGWSPEMLGHRDGIAAGLWTFSEEVHAKLCADTGIEPEALRRAFETALEGLPLPVRA
ncbi:autoinducer synthase [Jannaschia sp. S6380]|uniref:acyl-homoserine-lactone synthase n=1 Tax=Jannaschia sp. S6380 TaxID=2926408 RepID=UPI001FF5D9E7|nr:acyl-homoserine-lactone synthase [Jannaschia sp. S6380]MCK0168130.1 autoinducer synthase [Jannaschia sp. S6380]